MIRRGYTRCRYGQMHYREAGARREGQSSLVMLHQNPSSGWEYEPLMAALADRHHVIAFDTPGYGMSDKPPAPLSIEGYAESFADALEALEAEATISGPIDLYGFHSGTLLAIDLAILLGPKVRRVALTGIPMYPSDKRAELHAVACEDKSPDESGEKVLSTLAYLWDYIVVQRDKRVPLDRAMLTFSEKTYALERMHWVYMAVWSYDYSRLAQITQPVLVLQPHEQLLEASRAAAELIANSTLVELPELDREVFEIAPERLADELHDFLA